MNTVLSYYVFSSIIQVSLVLILLADVYTYLLIANFY